MKNSTYKTPLLFGLLLGYGAAQAMDPEDFKLKKEAQKTMDPIFLAMRIQQIADEKPVKDVAKIKSVVVRNNGIVNEKKDSCHYVCQHKECLFKTNYESRFEAHSRAHDAIRRYPKQLVYHCSDCDYLTTTKRSYQEHLGATKHKSEKDY